MSYVYEVLSEEFEVTAYFYNPNIMPAEEYVVRLDELTSYSRLRGFPLIIDEPDIKSWVHAVRDHRYSGEYSQRCWICYELRLEKTFRKAIDLGFDIVATSLSISPHKNAAKINEIGRRLSKKYGIKFYEADFKKNDGVRKSVEMSKKNNFYRQNYCGCIYSKLEKNKESGWSKKSREHRLKNTPIASCDDGNFEIVFTDTIDLHHFHPADTEVLLNHFLENAIKKNILNVRIIHGKGKSMKKKEVYRILKSHHNVSSFRDDSANWGATLVELMPDDIRP